MKKTKAPWTAHILTLFPEMFPGPLGFSIIGKALEEKNWSLKLINLQNFSKKGPKYVDDKPYGGGSGMIIKSEIIHEALKKTIKKIKNNYSLIYLTPKGKKFDHIYSKKISNENINIICGHFEGVDERILETRNIEQISVGDFVLSGGEIGAFVIIDTVVRLLPGVLGNPNSPVEESFERYLLEYPQYTKPQKWEEKEVPDVLLTGDHKKIKDWRLAQSEDITRRRRPDLWEKYKKNK